MKTKHLVLTAALMTGTLHAEFRTWTRSDGKSAELELIGTSGEGVALKGTFKMRNGKSVDLVASDLSEADAELVKAWKPEETAEATASSGGASVFDDVLDGNLEKLDGKKLKRYKPETTPEKYYVFYYTASWCGPCQKYTPSLVEFYEKVHPDNNKFELVLITSDSDEGSMEGYAADKKMPWPHLKLSKVEKFSKDFDHGVTGIPSVVVCDLEGKIVAKTTSLDALEKLLK